MDAPATCGTQLVVDLFEGNIHFDVATLIEYVEIGFRKEYEYEWLVEAFGFDRLNQAFNDIIHQYLLDIVINFGSVWDFVPPDKYEEFKAKYLDPVENAELIAKSDEMHYNAMAHMSEGLKRAQDAGTKIAIIANTEHDIGTSTGVNSDYIIDVHSASGAYCAPFGERFPADYKSRTRSAMTRLTGTSLPSAISTRAARICPRTHGSSTVSSTGCALGTDTRGISI